MRPNEIRTKLFDFGKVASVVLLGGLFEAVIAQAPACPKDSQSRTVTLSVTHIVNAINVPLPEPRIVQWINNCGIDFTLDVRSEALLTEGGASSTVIARIRVKSDEALEARAWNAVRNSGKPEDFRDFLTNYPRGRFATQARTRFKVLQSQVIQETLRASRWDAAEDAIVELVRVSGPTPETTNWEKRIAEGRDTARRTSDAAGLRQQIDMAIAARRWSEAELRVTEFAGIFPNDQGIRVWRKQITDGRDADVKAADAARLRQQIQQAIRNKRWTEAEQRISEFSALLPNDPEIRAWQRDITDGRDAEIKTADATRLKSQINQAVGAKRWADADQRLTELARLTPNDPQIQTWRKQIQDGRDADRLAEQTVSETRRLEAEITTAIQNRQWDVAATGIAEIKNLDPSFPMIPIWSNAIDAGRGPAQRSGSAVLSPGERFDFDTGMKTTSGGQLMLIEVKAARTDRYLLPIRNARMTPVTLAFEQVDVGLLRSLTMSEMQLRQNDARVGSVFGIVTASGTYAKIRIDRFDSVVSFSWTIFR